MKKKPVQTVYLMGIGGIAMGTLATMLHERGYGVVGSDQNVYPPMSDHLLSLGITLYQGYAGENVSSTPADCYVVGNVIRRENPEAQMVLNSGKEYLSMPQALKKFFLCEHQSIVVAGTHGKSTTSSMLSWILTQGGLDPSAFIGAFVKNWKRSYRLGKGKFMVLEGDEYDTAFFDKGPKFMHYQPHIGIVTSIEFDHADIFPDFQAVLEAFQAFARLIEPDGFLIVNADDPHCLSLKEHCRGNICTYGWNDRADWRILDVTFKEGLTLFHYKSPHDSSKKCMTTRLPGRHNVSNSMAAIVAARLAELNDESIGQGLLTFEGVRRRYDVLGEPQGILIVDDFAHHPTAVRETLASIGEFHPGRRLLAVFEPRTNSSRRAVFQKDYVRVFDSADRIYLKEPHNLESIPPGHRLQTEKLVEEIKARGRLARSFKESGKLLNALLADVCRGDVIVFMSNGSFDGLPHAFLNALQGPQQPPRMAPS